MSENKKNRAVSVIQGEYSNLCTRAGHLQYQIATLKKDLDILNNSLRDLNVEAVESRAFEESVAEAIRSEAASKAHAEAEAKAKEAPAEEKKEESK